MVEKILETERSLLGSMLLEKDAIISAIQILEENHFSIENHQRIFRSIVNLHDQNHPVDVITIERELLQRYPKSSINRLALIELVDGVGTSTNAQYYAEQIRDDATLRQLKDICHWGIANVEQKDLAEFLDEFETKIFRLTQKRKRSKIYPIEEIVDQTYQQITKGKSSPGLETGFYELDSLLGGAHPGDYIIIAGRPSMGKTALCLSLIEQWADKGVGLFTLETTRHQIVNRLISAHGKIDGIRLRTGKPTNTEMEKLPDVCSKMEKWKVWIDDSGDVSIMQLRGKARRLMSQHQPAVIIIDYLQLIRSNQRYASRNHEVEEVSGKLRALAKELEIPLIVVSQLSRKSEDRENKRPRLADLRESGAIEQDATAVLFVHRPETYRIKQFKDGTSTENVAEMILAKNKDGPTGDFKLTFLKHFTRFENHTGN